ncbi:hypothetical protein SAMN04488104_100980 [Algoriphagus faecimaris]|uniref:Uncharacterized protein n=1 Tax=Algoriphagus faecimaris TaxID=686796 RepID=A0A1G6QJF6_9BACT|nr:hypothetical protein [Algoriphagus faecimaris]SDC92054.1 hypothetical protein SAMN04488104_100980 [Algoriphagus faecimaris]
MKKKVLILSVFGLLGAFIFSGIQDAEATKCDEFLEFHKKKFLVTGCKWKVTEQCMVRCKPNEMPKLPSLSF